MKECKSCKTQINEKAKKCPNCQADQRNFFVKHKIITVVLAVIVIGVLASALGGGSDEGDTSTKSNDSQAKVEEKPEVISADEFADEFDANQVAAESKWKDKVVQFSAEVTNITDSGLSFANVGSEDFTMTQISCEVADKGDLMALKNGDEVTVKGRVGTQTIGVISVKDCSIVE